ncbi:MAG: ABC transporter substrate-binding protein, partial [Thermostichus sp. BF3_bins_97]
MPWSNEKSSQIGRLGRRQLLQYGAAALGGGLLAAGRAQAQRNPSPTLMVAQGSLEKISFGTNWYAQAEHGGFYQALATGIYREHGLDVTIQMGGPGINVTQLLVGGAVDTVMGASGTALSAVEQGIPTITVAAMFQKNPQIILAHPDVERFQDLR